MVLAARGHEIVVIGRREEPLAATVARIEAEGGRATAFPCDVRDWNRLMALTAMVSRDLGQVDVLVNSAGGQFAAAAEQITPGGWAAVIETNLSGTFFASRALFPLLRRNGGAIVNVVANIWQRAAPRMAHSGAARAGVVSLTRTLALEWASHRIRVNAISPGLTDTAALRTQVGDPARLAGLVARAPIASLIATQEVAEAVAYLAGDAAAHITGEVLVIDGGLHLV